MSINEIKVEKVAKMEITRDPEFQSFYADKLSSLAMGPNVSRLGLGLEDPQNQKLSEKYVLVMPTASVIEMFEILSHSLENPELKHNLLQEIEKFKSKFKVD